MTIRPYQPSDAPALKCIAEASGFPYVEVDSPMVESCMVAVDEHGQVVAAVAAERICQLYLWKDPELPPAATLGIIRDMHQKMATELRKLNYTEANCAVSVQIEKSFGRRLQRTFGWTKQWPVWAVRF